MSIKQRTPAERFHPGEYVREEITERGWSLPHFASRADIDLLDAARLVNRRLVVTPEIAAKIGAAFGTGAEFWLNLQTAFDERTTQP